MSDCVTEGFFFDLVSFDFYCVLFTGTGLAKSSQLYGENMMKPMHMRSRQRHVALWRLCLLPVSRVGYRLETLTDAKWVAERVESVRRQTVLSWPHYREVATLEPEEHNLRLGTLFPWLWKLVGTAAAITLGFLLGVLATAL
jgi:hypothetical protein